MFQFPSLPLRTLCIQVRVPAHYHWWVSPFGNLGVKGWSAPHPSLSQPPTSFFGSWRQGIHRVLLVSWSWRTHKSQLWSFQGARELLPAQRENAGLYVPLTAPARSLKTQQRTTSVPVEDTCRGRRWSRRARSWTNWESNSSTSLAATSSNCYWDP